MSTSVETENRIWPRAFKTAILANLLWINASEIARYFFVLRAMMQNTFPQIPEIAPMNVPVFLSWGIWDTILVFAATGFSWLYLERFGDHARNAVIAGTLLWLTIFVLLWLGLFNMNLASSGILVAMLPWAWAELVVAALVVYWCRRQ
jgi:hypothetical protein